MKLLKKHKKIISDSFRETEWVQNWHTIGVRRWQLVDFITVLDCGIVDNNKSFVFKNWTWGREQEVEDKEGIKIIEKNNGKKDFIDSLEILYKIIEGKEREHGRVCPEEYEEAHITDVVDKIVDIVPINFNHDLVQIKNLKFKYMAKKKGGKKSC